MEVREWPSDNHRHHNQRGKHERIGDCADEQRQDIIKKGDRGDDTVYGGQAGLQLSVNALLRVKGSWQGHTTVIVPINTFGGFALIETISAMKLAVRPIMAMSEQAWKMRAI